MNSITNSFYLIDDIRCRSGWDFDLRGSGKPLTHEHLQGKKTVIGTANGYKTVAKRDINAQNDGIITLEANFCLVSGDGFYCEFCDGDNELLKLVQHDGFMWAGDNKLFSLDYGNHHIKITLDMDKRIADVVSDGKDFCECNFTGASSVLSSLCFGYDENSVGEAYVGGKVKMYKNYIFNDCCLDENSAHLPREYTVICDGEAEAKRVKYNNTLSVYKISAEQKSFCEVQSCFAKTSQKFSFEIKYLPSNNEGDKTTFIIGNDFYELLCLEDADCELKLQECVLRKHSKNVWQTLYVEADIMKNTALVMLNGKTVGNIKFDENITEIDRFAVCFESQNGGEMLFSDIKIQNLCDLPCDYVPEPVAPKKIDDHKLAMLTCSLWRDGHHSGWDCITPFAKDHKPLLGWYDEGNPETADWEIKWLCEHGIDFQLFCWYASETDKPFKETNYSSAIHDGYMHAKYSDKVKMALLWEVVCACTPKDSESFRKYFVPYFIDHFFSDERYMQIDGKAVMSVFGPRNLLKAFGSIEATKAELDYLRQEVKKLGYKDLLIIFCGDDCSDVYLECGFDGIHAYTWGQRGCEVEFTKERILDHMTRGHIHTIPTISSGFNLVGWTGYKSPSTTLEDFETLLRWSKDELLTKYDKDSWKSKLMVLATWNEYGEGTYMCPSTLNGFGYLDTVRKVFTENDDHLDLVPSSEARERIERLHVRNRRILAPLDELPVDDSYHGVYKKYEFKCQEDLDKWEFFGFSDIQIKNGKLCGRCDNNGAYMRLKDSDFMPFSASMVQKIRVHINVKSDENKRNVSKLAFTNQGNCAIPPKRVTLVTSPEGTNQLDFEVRRIREWDFKNSITVIQIEPMSTEGQFELIDVEFLRSSTIWDLCIDKKLITLVQDIYFENGEYYIPFDTTSSLKYLNNLFWEWNDDREQFTIKSISECILTKDSDIAILDGKEIKLAKPVVMTDGIPHIPAGLFAKIMGKNINIAENKLSLE